MKMPNSYTKKSLKIADLRVADKVYQREIKPIAKLISKVFSVKACGSIKVGIRKNGSMWIVDGHQRSTAALIAGYTTIWADTYASKGIKDEAKLFEQINGQRTKVSIAELFRAALVAQDKDTKKIEKIVKDNGFLLSFTTAGKEWNEISCFSTLKRLYTSRDKNRLQLVLKIINEAWQGCEQATHETILKGLNQCLNELYVSNKHFNMDKFIARLKTKAPSDILIGGSAIHARLSIGSSSSRYTATAAYIAKLYRGYNKK